MRNFQPANAWLDRLNPEQCFTCYIVTAELLAGCRTKREQQLVIKELSEYQMLWSTPKSQAKAVDLYLQYGLSHGTGFLDCLIASIALENNLTIATCNIKHFHFIAGLQFENPYAT